MKAIEAFLLWLWSYLVALFGGKRPEPLYRVQHVEDLPDAPKPKVLYVAGEGAHAWAASMLCPCGCGEQIQLSLLRDASPGWTLLQSAIGVPSLKPSVWRRKGCRSHFFLRGGKIVWCQPASAIGNTPESIRA
jgi:hypothetical protein